LSGGQSQRVAIARALVNDPPLILADEPTGNLDSKSEEEILEIFRELHSRGKTIVIVTHDQSIAEACERIIFLKDGIIVTDTAREKLPIE
ncbi:MAG: ATP-binding cassette domain-containing protein, partial [Methanobacteriota archaeon]